MQWVGIFHNCPVPLVFTVKAVDMVDAVPFLMVLRMQKDVLRRYLVLEGNSRQSVSTKSPKRK